MPSHYADKRREDAAERAKYLKALRDRMPKIGKEAPELKPNRVRPSK